MAGGVGGVVVGFAGGAREWLGSGLELCTRTLPTTPGALAKWAPPPDFPLEEPQTAALAELCAQGRGDGVGPPGPRTVPGASDVNIGPVPLRPASLQGPTRNLVGLEVIPAF